ncbi:MAG: IclR family transcriptional regulator, partial [Pseudomonadota bacterium]
MSEEDAPSTEEPAESQTGLPAPAPPPRSGEVQSVRRALSLLDALAEHGGGASLKELAGATALAPSTAHRLLTTLESARFVRFDPVEGAWRIGVAAFTVGGAFLAGRDLSVIARPYLRRLMEITGETANLYLWTEQEPVCVAQVECRQTMRAIAKVGTRVRIHCSGAGKAIVAALP